MPMNIRSTIHRISRSLGKRASPYEPLITVKISGSALLHNFKQFQNLNATRPIAPVLKSNAYGHGLTLVAEALSDSVSENDLPFFIVDSYFEALSIRRSGTKRNILIIGYTRIPDIIGCSSNGMSFAITSLSALEELSTAVRSRRIRTPIKIQLKIDTGMHRQGILTSEINAAMEVLRASQGKIFLEGICSHFADADNSDAAYTKKQIIAWNEAVTKMRNEFRDLRYWHASNTAGHAYEGEIDSNISRLGMGLYGIRQEDAPVEKRVLLKPALSMETVIGSLKPVSADAYVGYNCTYRVKGARMLAVIPAGYYEGIDRRLSNVGSLTISGAIVPIVGRVSMNITMVDVTELPDAKRDDMVTIISDNPEDPNSIENIAKLCKTISYEILVHIPGHLKRVLAP